MLIWARERAGLSLGEAAERIGKEPEVLARWERGEAYPTYGQLEQLAESIYRRPVALFFFPEPPDEPPIQREFRILPDAEVEKLSEDTRYALRDALAFQMSLRELTGGKNPASKQIVQALRARPGQEPASLAQAAREYLDVTLEQQRKWGSTREAMSTWRARLESAGVFVFKRSFEQDEISGFCLADDVFPIIVVNNSTAFARQIFTLAHELGHLLFGISSITSDDYRFPDRLQAEARELEIACNRFAAELLVPAGTFPWDRIANSTVDDIVPELAREYSVSREVILRRLLDRGVVDQNSYIERVRAWSREGEGRAEGSGGNYYATQASYLGRAFLNLAFGQYRAGNISIADLADHLRVKARNVGKLEEFILQHP